MNIFPLGQSGFIFNSHDINICVDPYLSDSVEELMGSQYKRLSPVFSDKSILSSLDYILITHDHLDHCDPKTLTVLLDLSPTSKIISTNKVTDLLKDESTQSIINNSVSKEEAQSLIKQFLS